MGVLNPENYLERQVRWYAFLVSKVPIFSVLRQFLPSENGLKIQLFTICSVLK